MKTRWAKTEHVTGKELNEIYNFDSYY